MNPLLGLGKFCAKPPSPAGAFGLRYAPIEWVDAESYERLVTGVNNWQQNILFAEGGWLTAPLVPQTAAATPRTAMTAQAATTEASIRAELHHPTPEIVGELFRTVRHRHVVAFTDAQGTPWLAGTRDYPLEFTFDHSEPRGTARRGFTIQFTGSLPFALAGFTPIFDV